MLQSTMKAHKLMENYASRCWLFNFFASILIERINASTEKENYKEVEEEKKRKKKKRRKR